MSEERYYTAVILSTKDENKNGRRYPISVIANMNTGIAYEIPESKSVDIKPGIHFVRPDRAFKKGYVQEYNELIDKLERLSPPDRLFGYVSEIKILAPRGFSKKYLTMSIG